MSKWVGNRLKLEIFGTSHDDKIGVVAEGLPHILIDMDALKSFMKRRQGGQGLGTTSRKESDAPIFLSGVENNKIVDDKVEIVIPNNNVRSSDYNELYARPRPSHADYVSYVKEGILDYRGGGRFSGRLTATITAVGGILQQYFTRLGITSTAYISKIGKQKGISYKDKGFLLQNIANNGITEEMKIEIQNAVSQKDSVGAIVECVISGVKAGVGNDYFEGLESKFSTLLFAIPGVKGVEFGKGFELANLNGSIANDPLYYNEKGQVRTLTNYAGGINGGISNGEDITISVAFRPTPSIAKEQRTVDLINKCNTTICIKGRHDGCIAIRALPVVESATYIALYDELI